jgi:hypothetical protein
MNQNSKQTTIIWLKRVVGVAAIGTWAYVIMKISQSPAPFSEQAPYCMGSTMLIFGMLTMVHKGLDYLSLKEK